LGFGGSGYVRVVEMGAPISSNALECLAFSDSVLVGFTLPGLP
jgi:hypothetical protein